MKRIALCVFLPVLLVVLLLTPALGYFDEALEPLEVTPDDIDLLLPVEFGSEYEVTPLAIPATMTLYVDSLTSLSAVNTSMLRPHLYGNVPSGSYLRLVSKSSDYGTGTARGYTAAFVGFGFAVNAPIGSSVSVSWSGFGSNFGGGTSTSAVSPPPGGYAVTTGSGGGNSVGSSWYVFDQNLNILAGPFSSSGSTSVSINSSLTSLIFGAYVTGTYTPSSTPAYRTGWVYVPLSSANLTFSVSIPASQSDLIKETNSLIQNSNTSLSHIDNDLHNVIQIISDLSSSVSQPSAMEKFEQNYLERMEDQLSKAEDMMGPENTALPNGGDFAGFVSDVQDGLGVNGNSFNASDFADATSKFGDAGATGPGGPWEFFSEAVRDSLAGDASTVGAEDDDYIYAWLDEMQRRYGLWSSSSP